MVVKSGSIFVVIMYLIFLVLFDCLFRFLFIDFNVNRLKLHDIVNVYKPSVKAETVFYNATVMTMLYCNSDVDLKKVV